MGSLMLDFCLFWCYSCFVVWLSLQRLLQTLTSSSGLIKACGYCFKLYQAVAQEFHLRFYLVQNNAVRVKAVWFLEEYF